MHRFRRSVRLALAAVALAASAVSVAHTAVVNVTPGTLVGATADGVDAFLGIPYGASTAGQGRWRSPKPAAPWRGTREATTFGPACQQEVGGSFGPYSQEYVVQGRVSEDCLSLNVWRPARPVSLPAGAPAEGERLPIVVWVHGGGFAGGSGAVPIYNGASLARGGVIVITVNYRLGVFGFLAHPELSATDGAPGNYGLEDLVLALHWVKDNARALGGDPSRVTLAGQSAGSMAIHDLMVAPSAKGLFQRVISESGPGMGISPRPLVQAEAIGAKVLASSGVHTVQELRSLPASDVSKAAARVGTGLMAFAPVVDGHFIPSDPYASTPGTFVDTPVLAGMNADEAFGPAAKDRAGLERGLASTYRWATARIAASHAPVYLYLFDHVEPGSAAWGAFHSSEVPYAWGNLHASRTREFTSRDEALSRAMRSYWLNFIKTGNPNSVGAPTWPIYSATAPEVMHLGEPLQAQPLLDPEKRRFYDAYVAAGGHLSLF